RENVGEVREDRRIETARASSRAGDARVPEAIVQAALLTIGEHRIRFGRLLEGFLRFVVARVAIGMIFERPFSICALDLLVCCLAIESENLVIVALHHAAHPLATFTIDGRRSRSPSMYPRRNSSITSPSRRPSAGS